LKVTNINPAFASLFSHDVAYSGLALLVSGNETRHGLTPKQRPSFPWCIAGSLEPSRRFSKEATSSGMNRTRFL
jgi:hypothetical protein